MYIKRVKSIMEMYSIETEKLFFFLVKIKIKTAGSLRNIKGSIFI